MATENSNVDASTAHSQIEKAAFASLSEGDLEFTGAACWWVARLAKLRLDQGKDLSSIASFVAWLDTIETGCRSELRSRGLMPGAEGYQ
ncbi:MULTISPECIES: hypothetical protein [Delftia]|jgi:hypothetical protein|uniref:hypothetical protein n=1 Tax=Delftia TaxID=80865 RepID=UPI00044DEBDE|nr:MULTISPECIES: hypothetical protein [Delftia]EZP53760.1 hypothetical protein BW39_02835 [Delftia sp. RIT313]